MSTEIEEIEETESGNETENDLLLDSLEIKGYRGFEHLTIEKLGRVNLIVGKNNVGKTALLEAIQILVNSDRIQRLIHVLEYRDEVQRAHDPSNNRLVFANYSFKNIFTLTETRVTDYSLQLTIAGTFRGETVLLSISLPKLRTENGESTELANELSIDSKVFSHDEGAVVKIEFTREKSSENDLEYYMPVEDRLNVKRKTVHWLPNIFIRSESYRNNQLIVLWDEANKKNLESSAVRALQILENKIKDLKFFGVPSGSNNLVPHVEVSGSSVKVPLRRFGEGMTKILSVSLGMSNSQDGILLVDEIENGLHYSVLPDLWKLIFKTAKDLKVQVFATTHSKDCIEAFTQAAIDDEESDGMLIRLENKNGEIKAVNFNEDELEIVEQRNIEVR